MNMQQAETIALDGTSLTIEQVLAAHDVDELVLRATGPALPLQVDGDYLGRRDQVHLRVCRRALTVLV